MTGRIKIIRKTTSVVDGRRQQEEQDFFSCWCDVKSLGTNEKYNALQIGLVRSGHTCFACHNAMPVLTPLLFAI